MLYRHSRQGGSTGHVWMMLILAAAVLPIGCGDHPVQTPPSTGSRQPADTPTTGAGEASSTAQDAAASQPETATSVRVSIQPLADDPAKVVVTAEASGFNWPTTDSDAAAERLQKLLSLHLSDGKPTAQSATAASPAILGTHEVRANQLRFQPAFPLAAGERYLAVFEPSSLSVPGLAQQTTEYQVPRSEPASTEKSPPGVVALYPSGTIAPANHLKFYIVFSEPMQQGDIWGHFSLENLTQNITVPRPFRHTELWSEDERRLTLWFHPGRQKTGVNLNVEIGPILKEGDEYKLVISGNWATRRGTKLGEPIFKKFRAGPPDKQQPVPERWILSAPRAGTRDILRCELHEPLDWSLLLSEIHVETVTSPNRQIAGTAEAGYGEMSWNFEPKEPWKPGTYRLSIGTLLEDLAGNSIERPFEVDVTAKPKTSTAKEKPVGKTVYREFEIVAADQ